MTTAIRKRSKRYAASAERIDRSRLYQPREALDLIKGIAKAKFDETVDIVVKLGIDPRKTDQLVRLTTMAEACKPASVCRANVYVDGVQMGFDETISVDQTVPMEWVEAIEVYRRASEVPAEFLGRATCGVVAVWTRRG